MKRIEINYGTDKQEVVVNTPCKVLQPAVPEVPSEREVMQNCLANPVGKMKIWQFLENAESLLVIVSDTTRQTPTERILDYIIPMLIKIPDLKFLVGVGTHLGPDEEELQIIFGKHLESVRDKIRIHDSRDENRLIDIGTTSRGTTVRLNRLVVETEKILTIGNVEPHYFAGYSGGRKSILPAVAAYESIEQNHSHTLSPDSYPLALDGNPVHEDMVEVVNLLGSEKIFTIQTVLTTSIDIYAAFSGDIHKAFYAAVEKANDINCCPITEKADIVISCVPPPKDINLYQSQHALENGKLALKKDGIIIWVSKSRKGIGNDSFIELLKSVNTYEELMATLNEGYKLGYHKSAKIMELLQWAEIWAVTGLDDQIIRDAKLKPYHDPQQALDEAVRTMRFKGREPRVILIPDGGRTVPEFV